MKRRSKIICGPSKRRRTVEINSICRKIWEEAITSESSVSENSYSSNESYVAFELRLAFLHGWCWLRGRSKKTPARNLEKLTPFPCPQKIHTGSTPACTYGYTVCFEISEVLCSKKCGRSHLKNSLFALNNLPWLRTSFMSSLLCCR